ncbi:MAG: phosphoribosylformylglycinamidine synthase, partial [Desulfobulbaceae bacterium]|nr:phosphoribosylformylglycinamidine synthase [Desulfobulbaceae bacterium]
YKLAQLVRANQALSRYCRAYGVPCISGKDSMKNDYVIGDIKISIPPTLLFSVIAKINDVRLAVTMDAKKEGDLVYVLGTTYPEIGASEYAAQYGAAGNSVPKVREQEALPRYRALSKAMAKGLVASCHDCSDGGLGVALAETGFAGGLGLKVDLAKIPSDGVEREDILLFSESQSRFVVTVSPGKTGDFEAEMDGTACARVGVVTAEPVFRLAGFSEGETVLNELMSDLKSCWQKTLDF